jgi:hypothetical protein
MTNPELSVNYGLALEIEAEAGTWDAPTMAANAIRLAQRPRFSWGYALPGRREGVAVAGYGIPPSAAPGGRFGRIEAVFELTGSGTAATAPRLGEILETFMTEEVTTVVDYEISAAVKKTLSLLFQQANMAAQIRGAVPERLVIRGPDSENRCFLEATIAGILDVAIAEQAIEAQTFGDQAATPAEFQGALTVGTTPMIYDSFELDLGLQARPYRIDRSDTSHLVHGIVTQVNPVLRFPGEVVALSVHNPFTRQADPATALALSLTVGTVAGNTFLFTGDHVEYDPENVTLEDRDLLEYWGLELGIRKPASGTWLKISHQ